MTQDCIVFLTARRLGFRVRPPVSALLLFFAVPLVSTAANVPANFRSAARTDVGGGLHCVVGRVTKDGFDQRAYVYLEDTSSQKLRWVTSIPRFPHWYENRASHCVGYSGKIYVVVQSDSDSVPVVSQTLVSVATLDQANGHIDSNELVKMPDVKGAMSVLVYDGAENFRRENDKIVLTGEYGFKGDATETRTPFTTKVPLKSAH